MALNSNGIPLFDSELHICVPIFHGNILFRRQHNKHSDRCRALVEKNNLFSFYFLFPQRTESILNPKAKFKSKMTDAEIAELETAARIFMVNIF